MVQLKVPSLHLTRKHRNQQIQGLSQGSGLSDCELFEIQTDGKTMALQGPHLES